MPYIAQSNRPAFDAHIAPLTKTLLDRGARPTEFGYVIFHAALAHFEANKRYAEANKLDGVLGCIEKEFRRRLPSPDPAYVALHRGPGPSDKELDAAAEPLVSELLRQGGNEGNFNYAFSRILYALYLHDPTAIRHQAFCMAIKNASQLLYDEHVAPYEDLKIAENGDLVEVQDRGIPL